MHGPIHSALMTTADALMEHNDGAVSCLRMLLPGRSAFYFQDQQRIASARAMEDM